MAANTDWEDFPTFSELFYTLRNFVAEYEDSYPPGEPTWRYCNFTTNDVLFLILLVIIWTVLRKFATERILKPLAVRYALTPTNRSKMPESAWKFGYFLCMWTYTLYVVVLSGRYAFFQKPSTMLTEWSLEASLPSDIYLIYMVNCSFYLHSLYAVVFLDSWRKDSLAYIIHHVTTLTLLSISYSLRYHSIGTLVLLTHDVCDILLEFTKLNVYFKIQNRKLIKVHELLANASFIGFTIVWFVSRLYCFPMRVLYSMAYFAQEFHFAFPCVRGISYFLWILLILNIYWSLFIVQLLYRIATGQLQGFQDTREYDVEEEFKLSTKSSSTTNGTVTRSCYDGIVANFSAKKTDMKAD